MVSYAQRMLEGWREGEVRDVHQEMMRLLLEIVAKVLFDAEIERADEVGKALGRVAKRFDEQGSAKLLRLLLGPLPTPIDLRFRRAVEQLDELIYGIIDEAARVERTPAICSRCCCTPETKRVSG